MLINYAPKAGLSLRSYDDYTTYPYLTSLSWLHQTVR